MNYKELKEAHKERLSVIPKVYVWALDSEEVIRERIQKLGVSSVKECVSVDNCLMNKEDGERYLEVLALNASEMEEYLSDEEHLIEAILCEMRSARAYWSPSPILKKFGKSILDIVLDGPFKTAWKKAEEKLRKE